MSDAATLLGLLAEDDRLKVVAAEDYGDTDAETAKVLRAFTDDYVTIRRYLVDEDLLSREFGVYWRSGGPVVL